MAEATWPGVRNAFGSTHRVLVVSGWISGPTLLTNYGVLVGITLSQKLTWAVHLWAGLPALAAVLVFLLTVVVQPSNGPATTSRNPGRN